MQSSITFALSYSFLGYGRFGTETKIRTCAVQLIDGRGKHGLLMLLCTVLVVFT